MLENPLAKFFGGSGNPLAKMFGNEDKEENDKRSPLSKSIDEALADAPFGARMLANVLVKPLGNALGETLRQGADDAQDLVEQAVRALKQDPEVASALGVSSDALQAGPIFSSMSGSSSINGQVSKSLQLQFQVPGGGVAAARGRGDETGRIKLIDVQVQAGGRVLTVNGDGAGGGGNQGVIDVEATTIDV